MSEIDYTTTDPRLPTSTFKRELEDAKGGSDAVTVGSMPPISNHNTETNFQRFGRTDGVVFIDPEQQHAQERVHTHTSQPGNIHNALFHKYDFSRFVRRPVLHQWLQDGKVFREAKQRTSSRFELFFDLLFVGIIHQIAEPTAEHPDGPNVAKLVSTFCAAFSVWGDIRDLGNHFASDDVASRIYLLWIMALLVGLSNNAATIVPGKGDEQSMIALHWSVGFVAVAKFSKVALNLFHAYFLPRSRPPILIATILPLFFAICFLISIFVNLRALYVLTTIAMVGEYVMKIIGVLAIKFFERRQSSQNNSRTTTQTFTEKDEIIMDGDQVTDLEKARRAFRIPALNIEHHVDRVSAFVTIVIGEMVVSVFFQATRASRLNAACGRSILGLMVAFNLNWIYFDSEACHSFVHALRRHWLSGLFWTFLHLPLTLFLLVASASMTQLVTGGTNVDGGEHVNAQILAADDPAKIPTAIYWLFGDGIGLSIIVMAAIGALHRSLDEGPCRSVLHMRRYVVIGFRSFMGVLMILLPLAHVKLGPTRFLALYVGATGLLVSVQTVSKVERIERHEDALIEQAVP